MSGLPPEREIQARIARARSSRGTRRTLERLAHRDFGSLLRERRCEGNRPYLVSWDEHGNRSELGYADLLARVAARAGSLSRAGVRRGDRVALLLHNHPEVPISYFAIWALGASAVPVNLGEDDGQVAFVLAHSERRRSSPIRRSSPRTRPWSSTPPAPRASPRGWCSPSRTCW